MKPETFQLYDSTVQTAQRAYELFKQTLAEIQMQFQAEPVHEIKTLETFESDLNQLANDITNQIDVLSKMHETVSSENGEEKFLSTLSNKCRDLTSLRKIVLDQEKIIQTLQKEIAINTQYDPNHVTTIKDFLNSFFRNEVDVDAPEHLDVLLKALSMCSPEDIRVGDFSNIYELFDLHVEQYHVAGCVSIGPN